MILTLLLTKDEDEAYVPWHHTEYNSDNNAQTESTLLRSAEQLNISNSDRPSLSHLTYEQVRTSYST